jgi:hypothetical protein
MRNQRARYKFDGIVGTQLTCDPESDARSGAAGKGFNEIFSPIRTLSKPAFILFVPSSDKMVTEKLCSHLQASRLRRQVQFLGHHHQLSDRFGLHLSHHPPAVNLDGVLHNSEFGSGLFVELAADNKR